MYISRPIEFEINEDCFSKLAIVLPAQNKLISYLSIKAVSSIGAEQEILAVSELRHGCLAAIAGNSEQEAPFIGCTTV